MSPPQCLRVIWFLCASYDLDLQAGHIPGYLNETADLLNHWAQDPTAKAKFLPYQILLSFLFANVLLMFLICHWTY